MHKIIARSSAEEEAFFKIGRTISYRIDRHNFIIAMSIPTIEACEEEEVSEYCTLEYIANHQFSDEAFNVRRLHLSSILLGESRSIFKYVLKQNCREKNKGEKEKRVHK
jgi:hypothetical protein